MTTANGVQNTVQFGLFSRGDLNNINNTLLGEVPPQTVPSRAWLDFASAKQTIWLRNATNNAIHVHAYLCRAKQSTSTQIGSPTEFLSNAQAAMIQGFVNQGMPSAAYQAIGITPYESNDFTRLWKIIRTRRFIIPTNHYKSIKTRIKNFKVNTGDYIPADIATIAKKTHTWLIIFHGAPTLQTGGIAASFSTCRLGVISHETYKLRNSPDYLSDRQLSFVMTAPPIAGSVFINDPVTANTAVVSAG